MSAKQSTRKPPTPAQAEWRKKSWTEKMSMANPAMIGVLAAPVELTPEETDVMSVMNEGAGKDLVETLARGKFAKIALENGELLEYGRTRTKRVIRLIVALLGGAKLRKAMDASGLAWSQINVFSLVCPEFDKMFQAARNGSKRAMGAEILDTAFDLATKGAEQHSAKDGTPLGYRKKSEKMLDRLLVLSGREFQKDAGGVAVGADASKGGITLNFHFDGKGAPSVTAGETVDV